VSSSSVMRHAAVTVAVCILSVILTTEASTDKVDGLVPERLFHEDARSVLGARSVPPHADVHPSLAPKLGKVPKSSQFTQWPSYARDCIEKHGEACKPPVDMGGCTGCSGGYLYGAYVDCSDAYQGDACDVGPRCETKTCHDPRLTAAMKRDKSLILSALELSDMAYVLPDEPSQREKLCHNVDDNFAWHFKHYGSSQTRISWGVAHRSFGQHGGEGLYAISFRGTAAESMQSFATNWITNLKMYGWDIDGMVVHGGFMEALAPHKDALMKDLSTAMEGHTRLLITGHSLGGGLANLFALFAIKAFPHMKIELITAGSPRVGNLAFVNTLEQNTRLIYRAVAWCDPIARTPEDLVHNDDSFLGHSLVPVVHAGPQVTVGNEFNSAECHLRMAGVADHSIDLYIKRVREGLPGDDHSLCHTNDVKKTLEQLVTAV